MDNTQNSLAKFLEQSSGKKLPQAEPSEYKDKLVQFFSLLIKIDQKNKKKTKKNENL